MITKLSKICDLCGASIYRIKFEGYQFDICPNAFAKEGVHKPEKLEIQK